MKRLRPAFTLIEILISVVILSGSFIGILKTYSDSSKFISYISDRNKRALEDSLFLSSNILRYHKSEKSAYDILIRHVKVKEDKSRSILKKTMRKIIIPPEIVITPPPDTRGPTAIVNEVVLKHTHSASFWHFKIQSF